MLKSRLHIVFYLIMVLVLASCNKTVDPDFSKFGYEYYPMTKGEYRVYFTRIVNYNLDGSADSSFYLTKEVVEDTITYSDGKVRFLLGRYSADLGAQKWQKDSLWAALITDTNIIVSESNIDFIKLAFPVKENLEWDGNALNNRRKELYELTQMEQPHLYDTLSYANTLSVIQADLIDPFKLTEDDYRMEVYAENIGLVHKLKKKIDYCDPRTCSESGVIVSGVIFEQKLIEFGQE